MAPHSTSAHMAPAGGPQGQPWFDSLQHLALSFLAVLALGPIQLLLPLRALQEIYKIFHPLTPLLWARHISTAGQHDPCIALPVTISFIPRSLHHLASPPSPPAWRTLCKEWVLHPHLICPSSGSEYTLLKKHLMIPVAVLKDQPGP